MKKILRNLETIQRQMGALQIKLAKIMEKVQKELDKEG